MIGESTAIPMLTHARPRRLRGSLVVRLEQDEPPARDPVQLGDQFTLAPTVGLQRVHRDDRIEAVVGIGQRRHGRHRQSHPFSHPALLAIAPGHRKT